MKGKRFISLFLALTLLAGVLPAHAADQTELTGGQWENGRFSIRFNAPSSVTATLMAASYDNGRMTQVKTQPNVKGGDTAIFDGLNEAYLVRVFAIDPTSGRPLCDREVVREPDYLDPDDMVVFHDTVSLPTADPEVTRALSSALSSYAQVMLALSEVDRYLTETDDSGQTRLDAVSSSSGGRLLPGGIGKDLPRRPDLNVTVPVMAPVIRLPEAHPTFDPSMDKVNDALTRCGQMAKANAVLAAAAEREAAVLQSEVKAMEAVSLQGGVSDEQLAWAKSITEHYDAIESNKKIAQLARDMGCDAKRAYAQLVVAQNILQGHYANVEGDLNEFWEKRMIAAKAGCKVGLFVCATIATGGTAAASATAAAPLGYVTATEAAGIVVGAVDATLEVTSAGAKIIFGPDSKVVKRLDDTMKPLSDATLVFGLFTGGGSSAGEKLAFLGDLGFRAKELYDSFTLKEDGEGGVTADVLTLKAEDGETVKDMAEKLLDVDTGFDQQPGEMTADEVLEDFVADRPCDDAFLEDIIADMELDVDLEEIAESFELEVKQELDEDFNDFYYEELDSFDHLQQVFDGDGNLIREYYYGGNRQLEWSRFYDAPTGQLTMEQFYFDGPEGQRLVQVYTYYLNAELPAIPEGGLQLKTTSVYEYPSFDKNYYGDLGNGLFGEARSFNSDGTLRSYQTAGCSETYEGNNELLTVSLDDEDGTRTIYTYYTSLTEAGQATGYGIYDETCRRYVQPAGHLRQVTVTQPDADSVWGARTILDLGWNVTRWAVEGGIEYGYESSHHTPFSAHHDDVGVTFVPSES